MCIFHLAKLILRLRLLTISLRITQSRSLSLTHRDQRRTAFISGAKNQCLLGFYVVSGQRPRCVPNLTYHLHQPHLLAATATDNSENEDQRGMNRAFELLDATSPVLFMTDSNEGVTTGPVEAKNALKYNPTDDTPASNFGKSSQDEVEHYLLMLNELEGKSLPEEPSVGKHRNDMILGIHDDGASILDEQAKNPWTAINPILRLRGPVATGYGRGGKKLGVPTANVSDS